jgi:hypothetical protein
LGALTMVDNRNDLSEVESWSLQPILVKWHLLCDAPIHFWSLRKGHLVFLAHWARRGRSNALGRSWCEVVSLSAWSVQLTFSF